MSSSTSQSPLVVISPPYAPAPTDSCIVPSINKPQTVERSETVTTTTTSHGTTLEASSSPLLGGHLTLDRSLTVNTVNTIDTIGTFDGGPAVNAAARKPTIGRRVTFNLDNNTNDSHSNRPSRKSTLTSISSTSSWVSFKERFFPARKMSVTVRCGGPQ